uniref:RagB/SusD family nutrient uptake outer membrane protein n=1 Tax=uncultured Draconibacterium sp. TaxID=1573823 RepID=UPI003217A8A5
MIKHIKKISLICMCASILTVFNSCNEELEEVVYSQLTTDNAFVTKDDALAAVNGLYSNLHGISYYPLFYSNDLSSDVCYKANLPVEIMNTTDMNMDNAIRNSWNTYYIIISRCNVAIDNISKIEDEKFNNEDGNPTELKSRCIAEAKFLRGWAYMQLTDLFYKVPLNIDSEINPGEKLQLAEIETVESQIIDDLTYAVEKLPLNYSSLEDAGRPTIGAATGILAKLHMRIAGRNRLAGQDATTHWQAALKLLDNVISSDQYTLQERVLYVYGLDDTNVDTEGLAKGLDTNGDKLYNDEIIWAIRSNGDGPQGSSAIGLVFTPWSFDMGWNLLNMPLEFVWSFHADDTRLTELIARNFPNVYNTPNANLNNFYVYPPSLDKVGTMYAENKDAEGNVIERINELTECYTLKYKFQNTGNYNYNTGNNVIILRYADILLLKAEVLNELNQSSKAITLVNQVRERAFGNDIYNLKAADFGNMDAVRNAICDERSWELHNEGVRRPDLIRMGLWKEKMGKYFDTIKEKYQQKEINAEARADEEDPANAPHDFDYSSQWLVYPISSDLTENDIRRYYPIPKTETDLNPDLVNNRPGE